MKINGGCRGGVREKHNFVMEYASQEDRMCACVHGCRHGFVHVCMAVGMDLCMAVGMDLCMAVGMDLCLCAWL